MTWQQRDPFGESIATALGVYGGMQQGKQAQAQAEYERKRQQAEDVRAAALNTATVAEKNANADKDRGDLAISNRENGMGLPAPTQPQNHGKPLSPRALANYYSNTAADYASKGATKAAATYSGLAKDAGEQADKADATAIAWAREQTARIEATARAHHWSAQEAQAAKDSVQRGLIAVQHDQTTLQAASIHASATIAAANASASARLGVAGIEESGRDRRFEVSEHDRNDHFNRTQDGLDRRFKATQAGLDRRAHDSTVNRFNLDDYNQRSGQYRASLTSGNGDLTAPTLPSVVGGATHNSDPVVSKILSQAQEAMQHGVSADQIKSKLTGLKLTPAQHNAVLQGLGATGM